MQVHNDEGNGEQCATSAQESDRESTERNTSGDKWTKDIASILLAAAGAVLSFFGLFNRFLGSIAPPRDVSFGISFSSGMAQIATLMALMTIYALALNKDHSALINRLQLSKLWTQRSIKAAVFAFCLFIGYYASHELLVFRDTTVTPCEWRVAGLYATVKCHDYTIKYETTHLRKPSNEELLKEACGNIGDLWEPRWRVASGILLMTLYVGLTLSTATCLFALAEVIRRSIVQPKHL